MKRRLAAGGLVGALVLVVAIVILWPRQSDTSTGTSVHLKNFSIDAPMTLPAGMTTFTAFGDGPSMHELNIAKTSMRAKDLPTAADGTIADKSDTPGFEHLGEAEGIDIGDEKTLAVDLTPGHYVMYCNMEGHYGAGMATDFEVTG